jgi:oxygen-independent coproporphyrinogen-3 oxidase
LAPLAAEGLVDVDDQSIQVTAMGWFYVRGIAMVFDRYARVDQTRAKFSRII